jgi:hypothetical protein
MKDPHILTFFMGDNGGSKSIGTASGGVYREAWRPRFCSRWRIENKFPQAGGDKNWWSEGMEEGRGRHTSDLGGTAEGRNGTRRWLEAVGKEVEDSSSCMYPLCSPEDETCGRLDLICGLNGGREREEGRKEGRRESVHGPWSMVHIVLIASKL